MPVGAKRTIPGGTPRGFTLVEVLVALFVISVGLLGLAGMKAASMQATYGSYGRTQAINLAYGIMDRMHANRQAALANDYDRSWSDPIPSDAYTPACAGDIADCDLNRWLTRLQEALPDAEGSITVDNGQVTIVTRWNTDRTEVGLGGPGGTTTFTVRGQL